MDALASINELIVGLYRYGRDVPIAGFQRWALERVGSVIEFDSALWRAGADVPGSDAICLYKQPPSLVQEYVGDNWLQRDFLRTQCAAHPGTTFSLTDLMSGERWHRTPMYRRFARRYGIEAALCTHHVDPNSGLKNVVSLWRADPQRPFTGEDRLRKQLLMPHLVESMHANRLWYFATAARKSAGSAVQAMAICGRDGRLHDASRGFSMLVRTEWPEWSGAVLPAPLQAALADGRYVGRHIDIDAEALGDQRLLWLRAGDAGKRLGRRELQAARLYAQGLTYRAIATRLGVAPSTVRNQLRSSFAKLGVSSKVELSRRLGGDLPA